MGKKLDKLTLRGFKSIRSLEGFALGPINVLVGANGAGKSNFIDLFRLIRAMSEARLQEYALDCGGADGLFFGGPKETPTIEVELAFGSNGYKFALEPTASGGLSVKRESTFYEGRGWSLQQSAGSESLIRTWKDSRSPWGDYLGVEGHVHSAVTGWQVYHFHDTGRLAGARREHSASDWRELLPDAKNIAAFLLSLRLSFPGAYQAIVDHVRIIAPFFDDFLLEPEMRGESQLIRLQWRQKGSNFPFQPWQFSDGTLRFICLATALLQPSPPSTIIIDEPELGLHPLALDILAGLLRSTAERTQVVVSTQSVTLLNHFDPADVIVADRQHGATVFKRLEASELAEWLNEYSLGELWQKNVFDGGPAHE